MATVWKLLLLIAMLLMPLGMQPAAASGAGHHASMPMQHCPDQVPNHSQKGAFAECTMACSAALPATDIRPDGPLPLAGAPDLPDLVQRLHGLHPDTATPPPKRS